jgi:hypothetical protein
MKSKSVRLTVASVVAVLSVIGLSQAPADAKVMHRHHVAKTGTSWCC